VGITIVVVGCAGGCGGERGGGGTARGKQPKTTTTTNRRSHFASTTYLLQLELRPSTDIGIGVKSGKDAASNGDGVHGGREYEANSSPKNTAWDNW